MNQLLSKAGAIIVTVTVFLFAVCIVCGFHFGSYLVCMFLPIGYIMMSAGFQHESTEQTKVSANIGLILAAIYAVLILCADNHSPPGRTEWPSCKSTELPEWWPAVQL